MEGKHVDESGKKWMDVQQMMGRPDGMVEFFS